MAYRSAPSTPFASPHAPGVDADADVTADGRSPRPSRDWLALLVTLAIAAFFVWPRLDRGWVPHDEGMLGQTAERIRLGQLPHRDFEEIYTGALGYWHALAQQLFGTTLMATRYALFAVWLGWLSLIFGGVRRAMPRSAAGWAAGATVTIAMWTLPVYPSAMPSWYLLFVGTVAIAALLRWHDTHRGHWIVAAGFAVGIGLTIKITALYLLAAALLALVIAAQRDEPRAAAAPTRLPSIAIIAGLAVLTLLVVYLLRARLLISEVLHLIVPIAALTAVAADREVAILKRGGRDWREVFVPVGLLLFGVAIPVVLFTIPYALSGSLDALIRGVLFDAMGRAAGLVFLMKPVAVTVAGLVVVLLAAVELRWGASPFVRAGAVVVGAWLAWSSASSILLYQVVWEGARWLLPASVVFVAVRHSRIPSGTAASRIQLTAMTTAAFASMLALNQYPFSAPIYYCFVAPLGFLVLLQAMPEAASRLSGTFVLLGLFAVVSIQPGDVFNLGQFPRQLDFTHRLAIPRGGLRVSAADSALYSDLDAIIARRRTDAGIVAGPGMPEVTFLSGPPYRGHLLFHLMPYEVRDSLDLPRATAEGLPSVMVWNLKPDFGEPVAPDIKRWYDARLPVGTRIWTDLRHVEVRWR